MKSLIVPAKSDQLDEVIAFINGEIEQYGCSDKTQYMIELAIEEIFVNIASYAYGPAGGEAEVHCEVYRDPPRVEICFIDAGKPYNPLAKEDADTSPEALEAREGGLGILLVKKTMDDVRYVYENGKNVLTILKTL